MSRAPNHRIQGCSSPAGLTSVVSRGGGGATAAASVVVGPDRLGRAMSIEAVSPVLSTVTSKVAVGSAVTDWKTTSYWFEMRSPMLT